MKVVCISASQVPSSTANSIQVMKACQALAQAGQDVHLLVPLNPAGQVGEGELKAHYGLQTSFPVEWLPANPRRRRYDFAWRAAMRLRQLGADLAYVWPIQAALFCQSGGTPTLLEMHGPPEGRLGPLLFRLFLALPGKRRLLPITLALAEMLTGYGFTRQPRTSLVVSPNGVDLERYQGLPAPAEARRMLGLPESWTAGYTGHLYAGRGMHLLLELARRLPQMHFLWVGGRETELAGWRTRLATEQLANVTLTGFVKNDRLPLYQAAAEALLMPYERVIQGSSGGNSAAYASPMKMFEYMASRRVILSSRLPVVGEVLNDANAVLLPPEDAAAWAEALLALQGDSPRQLALAGQAWQDVQQYTWLERARRALKDFPNP